MDEMQLIVPTPDMHAMGKSLEQYVSQRVHQNIDKRDWQRIFLVGSIRRSPPAEIASWEKKGRPFKYQRPTATVIDDSTIWLNCFPCRSFMLHYGSIISAYLGLKGRSALLQVIPPPASEPLCTLLRSNLSCLGPTDIVILGDVHKLPLGSWWDHIDQSKDGLFAWHKLLSPKGKTVSVIGCKQSLWGEASGIAVRLLHQNSGLKCVLYVGKVGALKPNYQPNQWIATGSESTIRGEKIRWQNPLQEVAQTSQKVVFGSQVTVATPLCETQSWLHHWQQTHDWVDCESGHMALAANEIGIEFGYLHVVSDNLTASEEDNLSNEDCLEVELKREPLYRDIGRVIEAFITSWGGDPHAN